jgi:chromate transport protein ChrA
MTKRQLKFILPMILLIVSIIVGFTLLAMVYHGNNTLESIMIIVVIVFIVMLVKLTQKMAKTLGEIDKKNTEDKNKF